MEKTKAFIESNQKWHVLEGYISRIESYADTSYGLVIENCKSLIESIFKTIIVEVERKTGDQLKNFNIDKLREQVDRILILEGKKHSEIVESSCNTIAHFRNRLGETSHGKDIYELELSRKVLSEVEINFLLGITDNIVLFLLSYYEELYPNLVGRQRQLQYEDNEKFNEFFDKHNPPIKVADIDLLPSKVLFDNDKEAYKSYLLDYEEKDSFIKD